MNHDGEITGNAGNDWFFDKMSNLGFEHTGFHKGFDPVLQIRYHSVLDLKDKTADDIIKNMDGLRKRNTKKVKKNGVKVRYLSEEELPILDHLWKIRQNQKLLLIVMTSFITIA